MTKPIIGISGSVIIDDGGIFPGYHRSYVNEDYVDSVVQNDIEALARFRYQAFFMIFDLLYIAFMVY